MSTLAFPLAHQQTAFVYLHGQVPSVNSLFSENGAKD